MDFKEYLDLQHRTFLQYYRCLPISLLNKENVDEDGNRIIMPQSALDRLTSLNIAYPMQFQIQNPGNERVSHCGVLEFVAEEGFIHIPTWLMAHLGLAENDMVLVRIKSLPKATFVKLQPHSSDFHRVSHPRELLEYNFGKYTCMTASETITVTEGGQRYYLDVVEARPADAVCVIDTDCEVDFALALDYKEPPPPAAAPVPVAGQGGEPVRFTGVAMRMDGKPVEQPVAPSPAAASAGASGKPARGLRFGGPSAAAAAAGGGGASKGKAEEGGKEGKRFTGTQYSLQD
ncbi:hypothetical protein ACP70R_031180 [Stipagrostis hirtigluma subsp. patula]